MRPLREAAKGAHVDANQHRVTTRLDGLVVDESDDAPRLFHAIVLSCGPRVRELSQGDEIIVYSFARDESLYTGVSVGEKDRMFIEPDDVVFAIDRSDEP